MPTESAAAWSSATALSARPTRVFWKNSASTMTSVAAIAAANSSKELIRMPLLTAHTTPAAAAIVLDDAERDEPAVVQRRRQARRHRAVPGGVRARRRRCKRPTPSTMASPVHDRLARNIAVLLGLALDEGGIGAEGKAREEEDEPQHDHRQRRQGPAARTPRRRPAHRWPGAPRARATCTRMARLATAAAANTARRATACAIATFVDVERQRRECRCRAP